MFPRDGEGLSFANLLLASVPKHHVRCTNQERRALETVLGIRRSSPSKCSAPVSIRNDAVVTRGRQSVGAVWQLHRLPPFRRHPEGPRFQQRAEGPP